MDLVELEGRLHALRRLVASKAGFAAFTTLPQSVGGLVVMFWWFVGGLRVVCRWFVSGLLVVCGWFVDYLLVVCG